MLLVSVKTAVFDCICWFSSRRDRKGQSYQVEYCLESVEEYSEGTVHKSEPVYLNNQARGNSRIIRTEFVYDEIFTYIWSSCSEYVRKNILLQISFYA